MLLEPILLYGSEWQTVDDQRQQKCFLDECYEYLDSKLDQQGMPNTI